MRSTWGLILRPRAAHRIERNQTNTTIGLVVPRGPWGETHPHRLGVDDFIRAVHLRAVRSPFLSRESLRLRV